MVTSDFNMTTNCGGNAAIKSFQIREDTQFFHNFITQLYRIILTLRDQELSAKGKGRNAVMTRFRNRIFIASQFAWPRR